MNRKTWHRSSSIFEASSFAINGLKEVFVREQNVRIQVIIGTLVVCAMFFLRIPFSDMAIVVLAIMVVTTLEMINTSLELFADKVHPEYSDAIRGAKDIAAGAVFLASVGAGIVGLLLLVPAILNY